MSEQDTAVPVTARPGESPPRTPEAIAGAIAKELADGALFFVGAERVPEWNALLAAVWATYPQMPPAAEMTALGDSLLDAVPPYRRTDFRSYRDHLVCDLASIHEDAAFLLGLSVGRGGAR